MKMIYNDRNVKKGGENGMKSLKTIQTLSKIGQVLSKIAFVFSMIGFCGCIAGLISLFFDNGSLIRIGGVTLHSLILKNSGCNMKSIIAALSGWMIICVGEAVVAKFAEIYFKHELQDGTPFTMTGAYELKRLGILTIAVSAGSTLLGTIVQELVAGFVGVPVLMENTYECESAVFIGIIFIVMSIFCKYGAEIIEDKKISQP